MLFVYRGVGEACGGDGGPLTVFANRCPRRLVVLTLLVIVMAACQGWRVIDVAPWPPPVGSRWGDFCVVEPGLISDSVRAARVVHTSEELSFFAGPFAPPVADVAVTHGTPARIVRVNLETGAVGAELGRARSVGDVVGTAGLWAAWVQRGQDRGVLDGYLVSDAVLSDRVDSLGVVGAGGTHDGIFFDVGGLSWVEALPGGSAKVHVYSPPRLDPRGSFRREVEVPRPDAVMHFGRDSLLLRYGSGAEARISRVNLEDLHL